MNRTRPMFLVLIAGGLLAGCVTKPKPTPLSTSPSPERIDAIRADFKTAFPAARVGVVGAVFSDYAFVGQIDSAGILNGATVSFLDADEAVIANGIVQKVEADGITVKVDAGKRAVQVGDAAVKF